MVFNPAKRVEPVFSIAVLSQPVTVSNAPKVRPAKTESAPEKSPVYKTQIVLPPPSVYKANVRKAPVSKKVVPTVRSAKKALVSSIHVVAASVVRENSALLLMGVVS